MNVHRRMHWLWVKCAPVHEAGCARSRSMMAMSSFTECKWNALKRIIYDVDCLSQLMRLSALIEHSVKSASWYDFQTVRYN